MSLPAILALEDGTIFSGEAIGAPGETVGEVVFNTAMTGYQEILSDPSYAGQIVTLTYPHIGNVGVNLDDRESGSVYAAGLVIRALPHQYSNWRAEGGLREYLVVENIVAIAGIDTRRLTRVLRERGAMRGCILVGADADVAVARAQGARELKGADLAREVSVDQPYTSDQGSWGCASAPAPRFKIAAYDFGVKRNIIRLLVDRGCAITVFPAQTPAKEILKFAPDGVFLSNGPGDPEPCTYAIAAIAQLVEHNLPIFGICLGHQLLALALGARTRKMKFGHHGANHPVKALDSGRVFITSQNHGFAVDENDLPEDLEITHRSLFDHSIQGLRHRDKPVFGFQGHPEASPGPHDIHGLFDQFIDLMDARSA